MKMLLVLTQIYQTNLTGLPGLNCQNVGIYACSQVA